VKVDGHTQDVPVGYVDSLFDIRGRHAVVTGAASGLGRAIALGYAQAGAHLTLLDLDEHGLEEVASEAHSMGVDALAILTDMTSSEAVRLAAVASAADMGAAQILVNSAGTAHRCPAEDFPEDKFDLVVGLNLKGTYLSCQAFGRQMLAERCGSIINILSIGSFVGYPLASAYQASKGGAHQLTKALALEWHPSGVRVNGIAPTLMESPLTERGAQTTSETADFIKSRMLRPRLGLPRELIGTAIFLASDASSLVTGSTIACDDGYLIA
jgi:NAD(P)-dependent dehydrogenase (short-subunit alcohol dehydrogenase family)